MSDDREFQIEMLWDCPIGHKRQLGRNTKCTECGRPKTEEDEYYMPDEGAYAPEVTDKEMLADALAGPNWTCKFCGCHERRNDDECANCGVPQKDGDSEVWERDQKQRFDAINPPPMEDSPPPSEYSVPVRPKRQWRRLGKYIGGALGTTLLCGTIVYACVPHPEKARVQSVSWSRTIDVARESVVREQGFSPSGDAFNVANEGMKYHHTDHRIVGHHTEWTTERYQSGQDCTPIPRVCRDIPKTCTTTPRTCRKSNCRSNKNGYATCDESCSGGNTVCSGGGQSCSGGGQSCTPRYSTRQVPHTVNDYQDFPIFAPYYSWDAWRWSRNRTAAASGTDLEVKWPDPQLSLHEREAGRSESFRVVFSGKEGKAREWTPKDEGDFRRFAIDSKWTLEVDRLGVIHSVNPR